MTFRQWVNGSQSLISSSKKIVGLVMLVDVLRIEVSNEYFMQF